MAKLISYVLPVYNESEGIEQFYAELKKSLAKLKSYKFDLIFINDGSRDDSLIKLLSIHEQDSRVKVINFSRNFGHQKAITAGLDYAVGDAVVIMDTDLQDPPSVSLELIQKWEEGFEVVYAKRAKRKDTFFKRVTANWYYRLLSKLSEIEIPRNTGDFRLLDRKAVNYLNKFREQNRYMRGLVSFLGFKQTAVEFDRDARFAGKTGYSWGKMIRLALDGIAGFSTAPLRMIAWMGFAVAFFSILGILYALLVRLLSPETVVSGWTFLIIAIFFIGGVQMIMLGILGIYIGRIYTEVQGRPLYIVDSVIKSAK
ncbi:MAG: glycosyltransferase family 2 protein [Candidatus Doudnabacteria bacterium]|nr:glycosyltransferase family 2 protein [Candidatus Doudnabacteria bacterium]